MKNKTISGSLYVALGASSYGILATFVKLAYNDGFNTAEITVSQFILGTVVLLVLLIFNKKDMPVPEHDSTKSSIVKLIFGGTSIGLTSIFFYSAVELIPVGLGIVLLMQSIWMSVVLELVLQKKWPDISKIISTLITLIGTVLAVDIFGKMANVNWEGITYGLLSALAYTMCLFASNNIGLVLPPLKRSFYLVLGGLVITLLFSLETIVNDFSASIFYTWGPVIALFGTVIPPLLFTKGMPLTGIGLGAIIASIELPVSIAFANFVLGETITVLQCGGVVLIIVAVVVMNYRSA